MVHSWGWADQVSGPKPCWRPAWSDRWPIASILLSLMSPSVSEEPMCPALFSCVLLRTCYTQRLAKGVFKRTDTVDLDSNAVAGFQITRSEEHTSELQSPMRISYAGFCLQ